LPGAHYAVGRQFFLGQLLAQERSKVSDHEDVSLEPLSKCDYVTVVDGATKIGYVRKGGLLSERTAGIG
jgi:hypothetical protein